MPTLADGIQTRIAEDIISGMYPPGTRLDERTLAEKLKVSRTPVREALRQLAVRGLVNFAPMRGAFVVEISLQEVADLMNADCELEALCARLAAESMTAMEKADLEFLLAETKRLAVGGEIDAYLEANAKFHQHILNGCHNSALTRMVSDVRERLSPYRQYHPAEQDRLQTAVDAHDAIVESIISGDGEKAYAAMRSHTTRLGSAALRALRESQQKQKERSHAKAPVATKAAGHRLAKRASSS